MEGGQDSLHCPNLYSPPEIWRHQSDCTIYEWSYEIHIYVYAKHITTHQLQLTYACMAKETKKKNLLCGGLLGYPSMNQEQVDVARAFLHRREGCVTLLYCQLGLERACMCFACLPAALDIFKKA